MNFKREFTERINFAVAVIPNLFSFRCSSPQMVVVVPYLVAVVTRRGDAAPQEEEKESIYNYI